MKRDQEICKQPQADATRHLPDTDDENENGANNERRRAKQGQRVVLLRARNGRSLEFLRSSQESLHFANILLHVERSCCAWRPKCAHVQPQSSLAGCKASATLSIFNRSPSVQHVHTGRYDGSIGCVLKVYMISGLCPGSVHYLRKHVCPRRQEIQLSGLRRRPAR
jgi:hypothetical protein